MMALNQTAMYLMLVLLAAIFFASQTRAQPIDGCIPRYWPFPVSKMLLNNSYNFNFESIDSAFSTETAAP